MSSRAIFHESNSYLPEDYVDYSFTHRYTDFVPESIRLKEDLLLSFIVLDNIKNKLSEYKKMDEAKKQLKNLS